MNLRTHVPPYWQHVRATRFEPFLSCSHDQCRSFHLSVGLMSWLISLHDICCSSPLLTHSVSVLWYPPACHLPKQLIMRLYGSNLGHAIMQMAAKCVNVFDCEMNHCWHLAGIFWVSSVSRVYSQILKKKDPVCISCGENILLNGDSRGWWLEWSKPIEDSRLWIKGFVDWRSQSQPPR